jgi:hypothetical protein
MGCVRYEKRSKNAAGLLNFLSSLDEDDVGNPRNLSSLAKRDLLRKASAAPLF